MIGRHAQNLEEIDAAAQDIPLTAFVKLDYLSQISGGDKTFERQILGQFLVQMPEELSLLEKAIELNDFETVKQTAHSLKSTVGYIGLSDELHPPLDRMEKEAIRLESTNLNTDFAHVKEQCDLAKQEVEQLLNSEMV